VLFGGLLLGGLWFNKSLLAVVFDSVFDLNEEGWRKLTLRWAVFFLALAVLNEIVWRTQTTEFLGELQGVRRAAAHLHIRGVAVPAAAEIRDTERRITAVIPAEGKAREPGPIYPDLGM